MSAEGEHFCPHCDSEVERPDDVEDLGSSECPECGEELRWSLVSYWVLV